MNGSTKNSKVVEYKGTHFSPLAQENAYFVNVGESYLSKFYHF